MTLVPQLDRDRLAKVLALLGSHHDGEVISAARIANEIVRVAGTTWHKVLAPPPTLPEPKYEIACKFCLTWPEAINDWERRFLSSILVRRHPLSEKQSKVLARIVERVEQFATASS